MSEHTFQAALQKITAGALPINELIAAAQQATQAGQPDAARQLYQVWIAMNGADPLACIAHFNCSTLQAQLGDAAGAEASLQAALRANPDFAPAHINLGSALEKRGAAKEAVEQWKAGLGRMGAITGDAIDYKITLLKQISRVLSDGQQHEGSEAALAQAIDINPQQRDVLEQYAAARLAQCKWPIATASAKLPRADFVKRFHPLSACAYADDPLLQLALAEHYVDALTQGAETRASDRRDAPIPTGRRLRIGYVSSDMRAHAVGYLMANLFETHDRASLEVFVYYCGIPAADDEINKRIKGAVEHWRDIRTLSDEEAAAAIARDGIDILVDVNGHTRDARLGVFARRPAPIIVNWLGYPGTMGSAFHHYIIADDWVIPDTSEIYYSERVLRLRCYQPNDRRRNVHPQTPTRASFGLPDDAFVFCCFNAAHKITRFTFERWMEILRATPASVLWLLDYNAETNARLRAAAEARGVAAERLVFAQKIANAYHLARYPLADLFLDTLPYGAHTTASDALWMGVPVLTLSGRCFAARVCGSLVRAAGLPDMVCDTAERFVARAIQLAGDRVGLGEIRQRLISSRDACTLFDIAQLTASLEALYAQMASEYRDGRLPQPNLANLPAYLDIGASFDHDASEIGLLDDYHAHYRAELTLRHRNKPLANDARLWSGGADLSATRIDRAA